MIPNRPAALMPRLTRWRLWGPLLFWLVMIFFFSSLHKTPLPKSRVIPWDKVAHASEYAIMGYLAARAMFFSGIGWLHRRYVAPAILLGLLYGISDEIHQLFVPGRSSSPWDVLADLVGTTLGALVFRYMLRQGRFGPFTDNLSAPQDNHMNIVTKGE